MNDERSVTRGEVLALRLATSAGIEAAQVRLEMVGDAPVVDVMRSKCADYRKDARELWRRLLFNHLITNVDDHLHNLGFLYVGQNQWRLAPAFDLNPFPDKDRESKIWLSEDTGPITSVEQLLGQAARFELSAAQAQQVLAEVRRAVEGWRRVATSTDIGLTEAELEDFAPAFEHEASRPGV